MSIQMDFFVYYDEFSNKLGLFVPQPYAFNTLWAYQINEGEIRYTILNPEDWGWEFIGRFE